MFEFLKRLFGVKPKTNNVDRLMDSIEKLNKVKGTDPQDTPKVASKIKPAHINKRPPEDIVPKIAVKTKPKIKTKAKPKPHKAKAKPKPFVLLKGVANLPYVLLSAGHNPRAKGASYKGFSEYPETQLWIEEIAKHLLVPYILVPATSLAKKIEFINNIPNPSMALEIHFNAGGTPKTNGVETLYNPGSANGKELAKAIHKAQVPFFDKSRGVKEGWYQMRVGGKKDAFLARTKCPAIILEPQFVYHKGEIQGKRPRVCKAIAIAINNLHPNYR